MTDRMLGILCGKLIQNIRLEAPDKVLLDVVKSMKKHIQLDTKFIPEVTINWKNNNGLKFKKFRGRK